MATFTKINSFVEFLAEKRINLGSDQLVIALTNTAHTSTWDELADLTQITYTNLSSRNITTTSSAQTSGTYKLVLADLVLTSSGGTTGPFRYVYVYDDTATNDDLIAYYDYGSSITLADGDTFTINFDDSNGFLTIA
jgi:hypothetical protein